MVKRFPTLTDKTLIDLRNESARVAQAAATAMEKEKYEKMMNMVNNINEILIDRAKTKDEGRETIDDCGQTGTVSKAVTDVHTHRLLFERRGYSSLPQL